MTKRTTALALTACLALAGAVQEPPTAEAAPYTVKQCNAATGYTDFGFQSYINGNIRNGGTSCASYALYTIANPNRPRTPMPRHTRCMPPNEVRPKNGLLGENGTNGCMSA